MSTGEIAYLAFSERGEQLAYRLAESLGGTVQRAGGAVRLDEWTAERFARCRALVYVGAAGIAVRAIAPHVNSKASDPAVVVVDERGRFAVPLLSGHLGGANALARKIAAVCGATAVITTATDGNGVFAVDEWARVQNCALDDPQRIKGISARLLSGETVRIRSAFPIAGEPPQGVELTQGDADAAVDIRRSEDGTLHLIPRVLVLGVGCRRGAAAETLESRFAALCEKHQIDPRAVFAAASIDRKADEPGLQAFCRAHGWPLLTYSAQELCAVDGKFTASDFVREQIGVDNVCERSAVLASRGTLIAGKFAGEGVTLALAQKSVVLDWRWQDG